MGRGNPLSPQSRLSPQLLTSLTILKGPTGPRAGVRPTPGAAPKAAAGAGHEPGGSRRGCPSGWTMAYGSGPRPPLSRRHSPGVTSFFLFLALAAAASPACPGDSGLPTSCGTVSPFSPGRNKTPSLKAPQPRAAAPRGMWGSRVPLPTPAFGPQDLPAHPGRPRRAPKALPAPPDTLLGGNIEVNSLRAPSSGRIFTFGGLKPRRHYPGAPIGAHNPPGD